MFRKKKAIPAFLAFAQTATGLNVRGNLYPTSMITLSAAYFGWRKPYKALFRKINDAMHERPHSPAQASGLFRNSWMKLILISLLIIVVLVLGIIIATR